MIRELIHPSTIAEFIAVAAFIAMLLVYAALMSGA